jgi:S1-C subfamily serine protease
VISAQVRTILVKGSATRAILGISVLSGPQVRALGIERGILVLKVPEGSEAAAAGLLGSARDAEGGITLGDVIVSCDGRKVNSEADLFRALDAHAPGDAVSVSIVRGAGRALYAGPESAAALPALEQRELRVKLSAVEIPTSA